MLFPLEARSLADRKRKGVLGADVHAVQIQMLSYSAS